MYHKGECRVHLLSKPVVLSSAQYGDCAVLKPSLLSGHRYDGGDREAELAGRLVKQSVWSVETVTEEWFSGKFYEAAMKYDLIFGEPWLHAHRVSHMGHRTCFLQDPSASDSSELYYLHPNTKSVRHFKERNKLQIQQDGMDNESRAIPGRKGAIIELQEVEVSLLSHRPQMAGHSSGLFWKEPQFSSSS